eukprot:5500917-Pleurochrysis_carterae.AAC.2
MEKLVHGIRNGEVVRGPANERRMRNAAREGNKPSFWIYLKVNGCRGCQKQEEEETIHHVISGGCEAIGRKENCRHREEIRGELKKCEMHEAHQLKCVRLTSMHALAVWACFIGLQRRDSKDADK